MHQHTPKHSAVSVAIGHVPAQAEAVSMLRSCARHVLLPYGMHATQTEQLMQ
jgi:hypothetical protein